MAGNGWKLREMAGMAGKGWKGMDISEKVRKFQQQKKLGVEGKSWTWWKMAGKCWECCEMSEHGWKRLEMGGNTLELPEIAKVGCKWL